MTIAAPQFVSVHPDHLEFQFELEKQSYCDLKVTNNTEHHVAFKVKTTSPKKYFVRPNTSVMHPWDSCVIRVTLQAQREYPPNMQCKDKFLLQSTVVPPNTKVDEVPQDTFNKQVESTLQECKLRVLYTTPHSAHSNFQDSSNKSFDTNSNEGLQQLKEERDVAVKQTQQLQQQLETLRRRKTRKNNNGFSIQFGLLVGIIGLSVGFLLKLLL